VVLVGTSYRRADISIRERITRRLAGIPEPGLHAVSGGVSESAVLETCNRLEVYLVGNHPDEAARSVVTKLGGKCPSETFFVKKGVEAIRHIFRVASGLDSPVLGEEQILEQVREAGRTARTSGEAKSILSSLFDAAYSSGKRIRESYKTPPMNRSVSAFALKHALNELGRTPARVLLIGSGETAKLAALRLKGSKVYLFSARQGVETRFPQAVRIPRRRLGEIAAVSDLIIAATRRRGYVLTRRDFPERRKVIILDLGFPRNVDPSVRHLNGVALYDLDTVTRWAASRGPHVDASAERLVEEEARRFDAWLTASRLTPTLANIYRWAEQIRQEETLAALRKLPQLSSHDRDVLEALTRRLTGKLLSPHASFVKEVGTREDQSVRLLLLESIFKEGGN
jgi:glutamyl-tRNA reductase